MRRFWRRLLILLPLAVGAGAHGQQEVGPTISVTPGEYLKLRDGQVLYVAGVIDGMTFTGYGYGLPDHAEFVACARSATMLEWAQRTATWIRSNPGFSEGTATAVAKAAGASCKRPEPPPRTSGSEQFCKNYESMLPREVGAFWAGVRMGLSTAWISSVGMEGAGAELDVDPRLARVQTQQLQGFLDVMASANAESLHAQMQKRCSAEATKPFEGHFLAMMQDARPK